MKILKEYKGYQLIERYNKLYIRFWSGRDENMPCEFSITQEQANKAIENPNLIDEYISQEKQNVEWIAETFYEIGIIEYIMNALQKSPEYAKKSYEKLCKYKDIRNEFYNYVMNGEFPKENIIRVEGYTAEELCNTTRLNTLGAYNYLIYLRDNPEEALANLKAGLPIKDINPFTNESNEENLINLENKNLQEIELSQWDRYFYKNCVIFFECEREVEILSAHIDANIEIKNRVIYAGYADDGEDIVRQNVKKALEKAKELIDNAILESKEKLDRDKLIEIMELPGNIRSLPKEEQNEVILKTIIKTNEILKNIQCDNSEYELSSRQKATKNNTLNNIKAGEFLEAYYEITDFINNYGDNHNGKVFETEKQEIYNLIMILYNKIKG